MKISIILLSLTSFLVVSLTNFSFTQEQNENVIVTLQENNNQFVYSFTDQRDIPEENIERFINRINHLFENVDSVSFDPVSRMFSIKFNSSPSKEYLDSVFHHFKVNKYTLN